MMAWGSRISSTPRGARSATIRVDLFFFFQAEDGIRYLTVTGVQTCALPILTRHDQLPEFPRRLELAQGPDRELPPRRFDAAGGNLDVARVDRAFHVLHRRSEERRVGEECRSRWTAYHLKKKIKGMCIQLVPV